ADSGAAEGDAKDKPAPVTFEDGWNIKPDMVIEMPKDFNVPSTGTVAYQNILVKVNLPEDVWVVAAEMRAGNRQVLHHGRVLVRRPGMEFMKDAVPGEAYPTGSLEMQSAGAPDTLGKFNTRACPPELHPSSRRSLSLSCRTPPRRCATSFRAASAKASAASRPRAFVRPIASRSAPFPRPSNEPSTTRT